MPHTEERLIRIEHKADQLMEKISSVNATLAAQHETLKEHTRRSEANEKSVEILQGRVEKLDKQSAIISFIYKTAMAILGSELFVYLFKGMKK